MGDIKMKMGENFIPVFSESNRKMLDMPDCIYLTERCRCGILNVKECLRDQCTFLQSRRKREESQLQWRSRLNRMGEEQQAKIAAVYYGGKTPWKDLGGKE